MVRNTTMNIISYVILYAILNPFVLNVLINVSNTVYGESYNLHVSLQ